MNLLAHSFNIRVPVDVGIGVIRVLEVEVDLAARVEENFIKSIIGKIVARVG